MNHSCSASTCLWNDLPTVFSEILYTRPNPPIPKVSGLSPLMAVCGWGYVGCVCVVCVWCVCSVCVVCVWCVYYRNIFIVGVMQSLSAANHNFIVSFVMTCWGTMVKRDCDGEGA